MPDLYDTLRSSDALAESEARFRSLFEQTVVAIALVDLEGRVLRVNDAFTKLVGLPAEEMIGRDSRAYTHPDDQKLNAANVSRAHADSSERIVFDKRYIRPDGSLVWAQVHISPIFDAAGNRTSLVGIIQDVTERRLAHRLTQESEARLRFLVELDQQTRDLLSAEEVMATTARMLGQHMHASRCAYAEVDADEEHFTIWHDYVDRCTSTVGSYLLSFFGPHSAAAQRQGRTLVLHDVERELGSDPSQDNGVAMFNAINIKAIICCPLVRGGRLVAMMAVHQVQPRTWTEEEIALVEAVVERSWSYLERARTARVLRESEARLGDVVRTALDCIIGMDEHGAISEWNPAAEQTFGYLRTEAIGREMAELIIPPALRAMHRAGLARYLTTGDARVLGRRLELHAIRRDGTEFPVELTITRNTISARPSFTGYVRDITDRRLAETERESLLISERAARSEAEHASQMKDEFLSTLSHELRTPLNAILGWSQIIRRPTLPAEDLKQGLDVIERNARAQAQIIEDLLDMSRIVSGKVRLDVQRIDLAAIAQAAVDTARPAADAKSIRVQSVIDPLQGVLVSGDANRLQQILWNLITNAIKFTPKGGRVHVVLERVNSHLELSVADNGEGIDASFLPYVFDRFRQADASTTRRHGGLGLGLAIVKQLVELHGGTVTARSPGPSLGATFTISLPLTALRPETIDPHTNLRVDALPAMHSSMATLPMTEVKGICALVVDDEADARTLIERLLSDAGAIVLKADSATHALQLLQTKRVDVLVSDIGMPDEDGYALIRAVRSLPPERGGNVPAIALTAFARAEDRVRAIVAGFQMHVAKPVEPAELLAMVASLAGRHPTQADDH